MTCKSKYSRMITSASGWRTDDEACRCLQRAEVRCEGHGQAQCRDWPLRVAVGSKDRERQDRSANAYAQELLNAAAERGGFRRSRRSLRAVNGLVKCSSKQGEIS